MENHGNHLPSQFPAFRLTVARQMEAYRDRIARRIREEAAKRGESALDLAHELGVYPTTAERWFRAERTPQQRHRKQLAEHWGIGYEDLEPDLAAEERELRDQLDRIEGMVQRLLEASGLEAEVDDEADAPIRAAEEVVLDDDGSQAAPPPVERPRRERRAAGRRAAS